jgi:hypothetical protein
VIGLAIGLFILASERRREDKVVYEDRPTYR